MAVKDHAASVLSTVAEVHPEIEARDLFQRVMRDREEPLLGEGETELLIACGCAELDSHALQIFEDQYLSVVGPAVRKLVETEEAIEDIRQHVREKLLVAPDTDSQIRLVQYAGTGKLRALVRACAVRAAVSEFRHRARAPLLTEDQEWRLLSRADTPEMQNLKQQAGKRFKDAFGQAMLSLSPRDRNLLRIHTFDKLSIDDIAGLYAVHRATAARWLQNARSFLASETQRIIEQGLDIETPEYHSLLRLIQSNLDVSIERLLGEDAP